MKLQCSAKTGGVPDSTSNLQKVCTTNARFASSVLTQGHPSHAAEGHPKKALEQQAGKESERRAARGPEGGPGGGLGGGTEENAENGHDAAAAAGPAWAVTRAWKGQLVSLEGWARCWRGSAEAKQGWPKNWNVRQGPNLKLPKGMSRLWKMGWKA